MPTIKYSNNPNSDTAFVIQDGGQKNRTVLTAEPAGTLQLSDSANVSTGYVTDEDGKKHKVNLVAQLEGDIEFSENPNSTKGYATVDGKKHRVVLTASLHGGGSAPVIDELNVTPTTSAQTITAPEGTDGYNPVNVAAVTSAIDANITSANIKSGVTILGVSGSVTELNGTTASVTPTTSAQTITPISPNNGFTEINVSAVTSAIDANIVAGNIKKDVSILGVTGSYEGVAPSGTKTITYNGTHDVAGYANADVQVPTTAPASYTVLTKLYDGRIIRGGTSPWVPLPTGGTDIGDYVLRGAYYDTPANILSGSIDLSQLTRLSGNNCMENCFIECSGLTSVDLSSVTYISGGSALKYCFYNTPVFASADFSSLDTVTGVGAFEYAFALCPSLTSFIFPALTSCGTASRGTGVFANCFNGSSGLQTVRFPSLSDTQAATIFDNCFRNCTSLQNVYFNALTSTSFKTRTNQFNNMLNGVTGCTIHFPSNLDPQNGSTTISSLTGYPNFGGTSTVLAYDLPSTAHLIGANSVEFERSPNYDTATALAWRVKNTAVLSTTYYTSGTTDPQVNDTIYSDAACTTAVTTVSAIA